MNNKTLRIAGRDFTLVEDEKYPNYPNAGGIFLKVHRKTGLYDGMGTGNILERIVEFRNDPDTLGYAMYFFLTPAGANPHLEFMSFMRDDPSRIESPKLRMMIDSHRNRKVLNKFMQPAIPRNKK